MPPLFHGRFKATGENVLPFSVVKLGFVLRGHEFLVDHPDESSHLSVEDRELARYDELKGMLSLLIDHVGSHAPGSQNITSVSGYTDLVPPNEECCYDMHETMFARFCLNSDGWR